MAKKSKRPKGRSKKWSRANIMNFVLGGVVALSMVLGSVFVFGGAAPQQSAPEATSTVVATAPAPAVQQNLTPTAAVTPTPAATPPAASSPAAGSSPTSGTSPTPMLPTPTP
jgi:hypothetical protein